MVLGLKFKLSHAILDFRLVLSNAVGVKSMTSAPIFILYMRGSGNVGFQILSFKSNRINSKLCHMVARSIS